MEYWTGYFAVEDLALSDSQRKILWQFLQLLGNNTSPYPNLVNHWKVRPDNRAVIFESMFKKDNITVDNIKSYLATIFDIDPGNIDHVVRDVGGNTVAVFSYGGTNYIRMAIFGSLSATWEESRLAVLSYITANSEDWTVEV